MVFLIYLGLVLLIGLPLGQISRLSPTLVTSFTLLDVVVCSGGVVWLLQNRLKTLDPYTIFKSFSLFIVILGLSLGDEIFSLPQSEIQVGLLYLIRYFFYGLLFFEIYSHKKEKMAIMNLLLVGGGILLGSGYMQFFLYPALRNLIYAGWDEHFYRMFGTFLDPNFFGMFLVCYLILVVAYLRLQKKLKGKIFFSILSLATFIAIILSYSRTALFALIVGFVIFFWEKLYAKKFFVGVVLLIFLAGGIMTLVGRKAEGNDLLRLTSTGARIGNARNALIIFSHNPILGVGFNTYRYAQYKYGFIKPSPTQQDHGGSGADTSFLFVLATSGIVGFATFVYFLFTHFRILRRQSDRLGIATFSALLVGSLFVNVLFYPSLMVWMWVILGISENNEE